MILFKKAMRSIWRGKRSYIACIVLMAIGIAVYTSFNILYINLSASRDSMYKEQRFADVFANVRGIPMSTSGSLNSIPGVARAEGRANADARVLIPGKDNKLITLRVISWDPTEPETLNAFLISRGRAPSEGEILVGDAFMTANSLYEGDTLNIVIGGKEVKAPISGGAKSPEYVYAISDTATLLPNNETFGFAYMTYSTLAAITGSAGSAGHLSFMLEDGVSFESVRPQLEDALTPYGLISLYPQKDQPSSNMLNQEITSIGGMSTSMPMVFIVMAVIILYIMLKRVIEQERGSIGILKAFGYSDFEVIVHYMCYGLIIGGLGGIIGVVGGLAMSDYFTKIYLEFFNLPGLKSEINPGFVLAGMAISLCSGAAGAFMGTRSVLTLTPSEAMRPPSPPLVTSDIMGKQPLLKALLASNGYMAMRNITRSWFRSSFVVLGIAFSFCLIAFTASYPDMMDKMMLEQFTKVQLYDMKISLKEPAPYTGAVEAAFGIDGVSASEGIFEIGAELRLGHLKKGVAITAMERDAKLQRIYDSEGDFYFQPPAGGLVVSAMLADDLEAKRGDILMMKTPYTGDEEFPIPVLDIVNENLGLTAYSELESICTLLGLPKSANGVLTSAADPAAVKDALLLADNVAALTDKDESRKVYDEMLATYGSMFYLMQLAGMGVAFAIITNTSSVSLSERKREYATLRVLGMHPREIARILGFEYLLLTVIGFIPGIPLVRMLKVAMAGLMESAMFTFPLDTPLYCYIVAGVACIITVELCNLTSARQISKFDMVEVLKERE